MATTGLVLSMTLPAVTGAVLMAVGLRTSSTRHAGEIRSRVLGALGFGLAGAAAYYGILRAWPVWPVGSAKEGLFYAAVLGVCGGLSHSRLSAGGVWGVRGCALGALFWMMFWKNSAWSTGFERSGWMLVFCGACGGAWWTIERCTLAASEAGDRSGVIGAGGGLLAFLGGTAASLLFSGNAMASQFTVSVALCAAAAAMLWLVRPRGLWMAGGTGIIVCVVGGGVGIAYFYAAPGGGLSGTAAALIGAAPHGLWAQRLPPIRRLSAPYRAGVTILAAGALAAAAAAITYHPGGEGDELYGRGGGERVAMDSGD